MLLRVQNLAVCFNWQSLFTGINLTLANGQSCLIKGANGTGKTTFLKALAGIITPDYGDIEYGDNIYYLGHKMGLKGSLSVCENIMWLCNLNNNFPAKQAINDALQLLGMEKLADSKAQILSAGQAKKIRVAELILTKKGILLLDEPFVNLDAMGAGILQDYLNQHLENGGGIVMSDHNDARISSDYIIDMDRAGKVAE